MRMIQLTGSRTGIPLLFDPAMVHRVSHHEDASDPRELTCILSGTNQTVVIESPAEVLALIEAARMDERRFEAAKAAMQGYNANPKHVSTKAGAICGWAVKDADLLLAALAKEKP